VRRSRHQRLGPCLAIAGRQPGGAQCDTVTFREHIFLAFLSADLATRIPQWLASLWRASSRTTSSLPLH
jgi:hypothetical protein